MEKKQRLRSTYYLDRSIISIAFPYCLFIILGSLLNIQYLFSNTNNKGISKNYNFNSNITFGEMGVNNMVVFRNLLDSKKNGKIEKNKLKQIKEIKKQDSNYELIKETLLKLHSLGYRQTPVNMQALPLAFSQSTIYPPLRGGKVEVLPFYKTDNQLQYLTLSENQLQELEASENSIVIGNTEFNCESQKFCSIENKFSFTRDPICFALSIDPLAEKFPSQSPYSALDNNSINKIDPNGMEAKDFETWLRDERWKLHSKIGDFMYDNIYSITSTEKLFDRAVKLGLWDKTQSLAMSYGKSIESDGSKALTDPVSPMAIQTLSASSTDGLNYGGYLSLGVNKGKPTLTLQAFANEKGENILNQNSATLNYSVGDDYAMLQLSSSIKYSDQDSKSFSQSASASFLLHDGNVHFSTLDFGSTYSNTSYSFVSKTSFDIEGKAQAISFSGKVNPYKLADSEGFSLSLPSTISGKLKSFSISGDVSLTHSYEDGNSLDGNLK